jgi:tight adherence protein B
MRVRLFLAALVGSLAVAAAPASAATGSLDLVSVDTSGGQVTTVVAAGSALAGHDLTTGTWTVKINGKDVKVHVEPVSNANLEVVLALDTSGSMAGAPMDAAKAAAETFVSSLPASARVAVVSFSSTPNVLVPMTTDRNALVGAIRGLQAKGETALYDAVKIAAAQFSPGRDARRQLVVLSDGGDTVSKADEGAAIDALTAVQARGYVASLVTKDSATAVLDELAGRTGGQVVSATDVAAIRSVFGDIGAALTNQYRVSFPATETGQVSLSLAVSQGGATASADRVIDVPVQATPTTPTTLPPARVSPVVHNGWMKSVGLLAAVLGMLILGVYAFAAPSNNRKRLASRWIAEHSPTAVGHETSLQDFTNRASEMAERSLQRRGWAVRLDESLERAGMPIRPGEFALIAIGAVAGAFVVGVALFGTLVALALAVAAAFMTRTFLRFKVSRRKSKFESQLGETLGLMSGSLRAGYGLAQALDAVAKNSESPTADEFNRLIMEMRVGRNLTESLEGVATRIGSTDFAWVVEAIGINREIGGDLTELLDRAAATIRDRENVRRQIKTLSAEGRLSAVVLMGIPILLFFYLKIANPDYIGVLTSTPLGWIMLMFAAGGMTLGGLWLRNIVKVVF